MANRFLKTLASAFVVENENNDTVDAQSTQGGQAAVPSSPNPQPMNNTTVTQHLSKQSNHSQKVTATNPKRMNFWIIPLVCSGYTFR